MIIQKIILGISLSAPFGPLSAEALSRGLKGGFWAAFRVRMGGAIGNLTCLILASLFISYLHKMQLINTYITSIAAVALISLGCKQFRIDTNDVYENYDGYRLSKNSDWFAGLFLAIFNPYGIIWWMSIYTASMTEKELSEKPSISAFIDNLYIILGIVIWIFIFSYLVGLIRRRLSTSLLSILTRASSAFIIGYGIYYALVAGKTFLS